MKTEGIIGNADLVSGTEEEVARLLRDKYLRQKNLTAARVKPKDTFYTRHGKRALDLIIAVPAFVLLLPLNIIFGICTFFDVGLPIFYRQTRVGKDGRHFTLVKFRNMNNKRDSEGRLLPPSERVTRFGRFMRKFSLDELLNFYSVIRGDMSIIGPRPQPVFLYERMCDRHRMRTALRPGLECPRVIHVPGEEICKYQQTFENDIWYVEHVSFLQDVRMVFLLIKMVFSMGKRSRQATGKGISYFVGYNKDGIAISMNVYREMTENGVDV